MPQWFRLQHCRQPVFRVTVVAGTIYVFYQLVIPGILVTYRIEIGNVVAVYLSRLRQHQ